MKTIVISGMLVKHPRGGQSRGDYTDIDLAYNVTDDVTIDDVVYYINNAGSRVVAARTDGEKLEYAVGIDRDRNTGKKPLNRIAFARQLRTDMKTLEWRKDVGNVGKSRP